MTFLWCQHFIVVALLISEVKNENATNKSSTKIDPKCPFTKIIEDIFKVHNKTTDKGIFVEDNKKTQEFIQNITHNELPNSKNETNDEVNRIIDSINRIKSNMTQGSKDDLNEAVIITLPNNPDYIKLNSSKITNTTMKDEDISSHRINDKDSIPTDTTEIKTHAAENKTYVEILTIEPNNTNRFSNHTSMNIIELLKNIMPMFNSTITNEIHNLTIIERDNTKNNSFSTVKNISTIVVTYCDHKNMTKINSTNSLAEETILKQPENETSSEESEYFESRKENTESKNENTEKYNNFTEDHRPDVLNLKADFVSPGEEYELKVTDENLTEEEKRDLIEAADYGMKKMHELYTVMEPKLYSLGYSLDDSDPARYVAAFNAPAEDATLYAKYGYASLQAAVRLRELTSSSDNLEGLESRQDESLSKVNLLQQSSLLRHCPIRGVPKCPPASKRYRTHDGTCNNFNRPKWGSTMTPVQRFLPPSYSDGIQAPRRSVRGSKLPSAREISSFIHEDKHVETESITHLLMQWGQFIDHDITSSSQTRGFNGSVPRCCRNGGRDFVPKELMHPECMPIEVPPSDPFYGPRGVKCLDFIRSSPAPHDDCSLGWREQLNQVSAYIDGSPLYGSSVQKSDKLRLFRNGMLQYGKVQQRKPVLPPEKKDELCRGGAVSAECFKSGDARVNEHPGLVAAHIVWLRQHNRMAQELAHLNPQWSDEKIYQETRKIIGALLQHITYNEFLPIVLGSEVMRLFDLEPQKKGYYRNYDTKANPSPASSFGSAAFRFGHSLVQSSMMRFDRFHRPMQNNVTLHDEPTNPSNIWSVGAVDRLLLGMVNQPIQKRDEFITEELTNHLFQTPKFDFGMDLAAINIQRGRDHGLPGYTAWRGPCGLTPLTEFESLFKVMPARTVKRLQALYRHVDDIDLFTGGMAERPVVGGLVGPTFACIIAQQFSNLRNGDRFWYENGGFDSSFTPAQLQQIRHMTFAQVICRTLDSVDNIQPFVFLSPENDGNKRISCRTRTLSNFDLSPWVEIDENSKNDLTPSDKNSKNDLTIIDKNTKNDMTRNNNHIKNNSNQNDNSTKISTKITSTTRKPTTTRRLNNIDAFLSKVTKRQQIPLLESKPKHNLTLHDVIKYATDSNKDKITLKLDKLDIRNKNKRYENSDFDGQQTEDTPDFKTRYEHYEDDDDSDIQSVQSVVINNSPHKRPHQKPHYNRPVISVTENIDKFTYLINYVPRQTQSWRQTTKKPDREIVKITYQNYDDTYRRPNQPYKYQNYNREDDNKEEEEIEFNYRSYLPDRDSMTKKEFNTLAGAKESDQTSTKLHNTDSTTDNSHKLLTFGYVGTYKRHNTNDFEINANTDAMTNDFDSRNDALSKDFSTNDQKRHDLKLDDMKFSTFYLLDTSTKPYDSSTTLRTKRYDSNYYDKTSDNDMTIANDMIITDKQLTKYDDSDDVRKDYNNNPEIINMEDRSDSIPLTSGNNFKKPLKDGLKNKKPSSGGAAKTPSIAFHVIPSENSPSLWAVYEEDSETSDQYPEQPAFESDPLASREIPRPFKFGISKLRRPWKH